jgi:ATP-dependent Zn protease
MNTKFILAVVLAIIVVAAWAVNAHRNKGFKTVSSEEFAQIIGDTATVQLLDVRTKEEYEEGHIADAMLVDFYSYNFEEQAAKPEHRSVNNSISLRTHGSSVSFFVFMMVVLDFCRTFAVSFIFFR